MNKNQSSAKAGRTYGGLSQEERRANRRQQFMDAGLEVFGTDGFRAATVRGLCREAKLTDRYFYECCGSLESLICDVYEQCMGRIRERVESAIAEAGQHGDAEQLICAALDAFFSELEDSRVARICMVELEGISYDVNRLYYGYINGFAELIIELAKSVYPHWALSEDESRVLGLSLVGAMRQAATDWLLSDYAIDRQTMVRATSRLLIGLARQIESDQS